MKRLLITGGTSGIGFEYIDRFGDQYDEVYVYGRKFNNFKSIKSKKFVLKHVDFSQGGLNEALDDYPVFDHICICAGYVENNILQFYDSEITAGIIQTNLISQIDVIGSLVAAKKIARGASIVVVGSLLGSFIGMPGGVAYAASKAGLEGAVKVMALELARKKIRINTVCPGMVDTELTSELTVISDSQFEADKKKYPLGQRYASKEDVVRVVNFLLGDDSAFITGETLKVDGGYTVGR